MTVNVLVVAKKPPIALPFLNALALPDVKVTFSPSALQAIKNVKRVAYDFIIVGDQLVDGDIIDVGLAIEGSKRNKKTPVVCVGYHVGRAARFANVLSPSVIRAEPGDEAAAVSKIKNFLKAKQLRSDGE